MIEGFEGVALYQAAQEFTASGLEPGEPLVFLLSCAALVLSILASRNCP